MKRLLHISIIIILTVLMGSGFYLLGATSTSALTFSSDVDISFTFNPTISLSLSSSDLVIANLAPGSVADSNEITVTVSTNTAYGYTLNATVGQQTNYETRNLILDDYSGSSSDPIFTSLAYGDSESTLATDNTWGYAFKTSTANAPWSNYSGLPLYSDSNNVTELIDTDGAAASDYVTFKIGARAASTQAGGEYKNVISFIAVAKPEPVTLEVAYRAANKTKLNGYYKLQDMDSSICAAVEVIDDELQVIDTRDNKVYWIAKLADNHCWMTQNLDLDLGTPTLTHNSTTLYHDDTDLGWGTDTATTSWTPNRATIAANPYGSFTGWSNQYTQQYSADPGDWYYAGYDGTTLLASTTVNYLTSTNKVTENGITTVYNDANYTTAYFSNHPFTGAGTSNNGTHGHVGNYYNWSAAVASNDTSAYASSTYSNPDNNPQNSICPAGWRLPTVTNANPTYETEGSKNEFARLAKLYAGYSGKTSLSSAGLEASPLFFARSGGVGSGSLENSGFTAFYWSSSVDSDGYAYVLKFDATSVAPADDYGRRSGRPVRCIAR
ncbi:hypothetical protein IKG49_03635 [Candidatus Saccharibacteria bacterium]|nr:hypothetical protein [Candidatus Saccharibacteria bacterium]